MRGTGTMLVTCVGLFSEEGIIQKLITGVGQEETERLNNINKGTRAAMRLAALAFGCLQRNLCIIHRLCV